LANRLQAFNDGLNNGFTQGRDAGFVEGTNTGFQDGVNRGFNDGKGAGFNEGLNMGFQVGRVDMNTRHAWTSSLCCMSGARGCCCLVVPCCGIWQKLHKAGSDYCKQSRKFRHVDTCRLCLCVAVKATSEPLFSAATMAVPAR
jgi:hypothetical protein